MTDNEEAYFYYSIHEFENLILEHGLNYVMERLSPSIKDKIFQYIQDEEHKQTKRVCALCS